MNIPDKLPESFKTGIKALSIDASSIIYLLKVGILGYAAAEIELYAPEAIIQEVGWPRLPVKSCSVKNENLTNDETVIQLAKDKQIPLMSEDRELLESARERGVEHYNSLMILNYLLLKKRIADEDFSEYMERLNEVARYGEDVLRYGEVITGLVLNELKR